MPHFIVPPFFPFSHTCPTTVLLSLPDAAALESRGASPPPTEVSVCLESEERGRQLDSKGSEEWRDMPDDPFHNVPPREADRIRALQQALRRDGVELTPR